VDNPEGTFGDKLRHEEERTGQKPHQICKALFELDLRTYHYWKSGQRVPSEWLQKLILHRLRELPRDPKDLRTSV